MLFLYHTSLSEVYFFQRVSPSCIALTFTISNATLFSIVRRYSISPCFFYIFNYPFIQYVIDAITPIILQMVIYSHFHYLLFTVFQLGRRWPLCSSVPPDLCWYGSIFSSLEQSMYHVAGLCIVLDHALWAHQYNLLRHIPSTPLSTSQCSGAKYLQESHLLPISAFDYNMIKPHPILQIKESAERHRLQLCDIQAQFKQLVVASLLCKSYTLFAFTNLIGDLAKVFE